MADTQIFQRAVASTGTTCKVLVAEDETALRKSLVRVLEAAGHEVTSVPDGAAALEALKKGSFDVVLSDIQMPGMSGLDLLHVVRAYDLDIPVVLLTADPRVETAATAVEYGVLRYLIKPVSGERLLETVALAGRLRRMASVKRQMAEVVDGHSEIPSDRDELEARFDRALAGMHLAYQPIVNGRTRRIAAYEALLRSKEPSLPDPLAVLAAAERLRRIHDVGRRVRAIVAEDIKTLPDPDALLFVNLHTRDLLDPELLSHDSAFTAIAPRVVLEITERASLHEIPDIRTKVADLRALGFRLAIDDLGAGYSGLSSFASLEPEFVKLDISLVRDVHESAIRQRLVEAMVSLCLELGSRIVAEGIERVEERDTLLRLQCELLQGYLFARPGPPFAKSNW